MDITIVVHQKNDFPKNLLTKMQARFNSSFHFDPAKPREVTIDGKVPEAIIYKILKDVNILVSYLADEFINGG